MLNLQEGPHIWLSAI